MENYSSFSVSMADRPKTLERWAYIDALRGWAALGVLTAHTAWFFPLLPWRAVQISLFSTTGVQLFFMVSAITLIASWRKGAHLDSHPIAAFFVRRLFRIAPMFWIAMIVYISSFEVFGPIWRNGTVDMVSVIFTVLFAHGWSPNTINSVVPGGWSIAVEMTFYMVFPILILVVTNLRRSVIFFALAILMALTANFAAAKFYDASGPFFKPFVYYWFPNQLPVFAVGFMTWYLIPKIQHASWALVVGLTCVGLFFLLLGTFSGLRYSAALDHPAIWRDMAACAGFMSIILALSARPWSFLVNRITIMLGKISFSSYLLQFAVIQVLLSVIGPMQSEGVLAIAEYALGVVGVLVINTLLAIVTYRYVEKPWIRSGRLFASLWPDRFFFLLTGLKPLHSRPPIQVGQRPGVDFTALVEREKKNLTKAYNIAFEGRQALVRQHFEIPDETMKEAIVKPRTLEPHPDSVRAKTNPAQGCRAGLANLREADWGSGRTDDLTAHLMMGQTSGQL